jgi:hypothetical protein
MKKVIITLFLVFFFSLNAFAQHKLTVSADAAVYNKYIFRGAVLNNGPVFQPDVIVKYGPVSLTVWGSMDAGDANDRKGELTEVDYIPSITFVRGKYSISRGSIIYDFLGADADPPSTTEFFFNLAFVNALNPSFTVFQDVDETKGKGVYFNAAVSHVFPLNDRASLNLSLSLGMGSKNHNAFYYCAENGGVTDLFIGFNAPITLSKNFSLTPVAGLFILVDNKIREACEKKEVPLLGVKLSGTF